MVKKIVKLLTTLMLVILPFIVGVLIGKYSPYVEANSFKTYVIIWSAISIAFAAIVLVVSKYYSASLGGLVTGGLLLFLLVSPIAGIIGFATAPDVSLKMLEHPEREHLRYIFLFIAAMLFAAFFLFLIYSNSLQIRNAARWIAAMFFILAFVEFIWEFTHHYFYPEAMKEWIDKGNNADEFVKMYENLTVISIGVLGRLIQFSLLIWLSVRLFQLRYIKLWGPIIITLFGLLGIASAIVVYATQMNLPKGFEIIFLFFIPGMPFLLFYWLGIGLLTQFKRDR